MKTKYVKPSVEVVVMKTTSILAGSFDQNISNDPYVNNAGQILSTDNNYFGVWGDDEE